MRGGDAAGYAGLFPGQLSEKAGMGEALARRYESVEKLFDEVRRRSGVDIPAVFFGAGGTSLHDDRAAQVGVFAVSLASLEVLEREHGSRPGAVAGYSLGTYAAFVAAGTLERWAALDVLLEVLRILEERPVPGRMGFVIGLTRPAVEEALGDGVWIANQNAAQQFVLTGEAAAVSGAIALLKPLALSADLLPIGWAMHSPLLLPLTDRLATFVARLHVEAPRRALYAPMLGRRVADADEAREVLARQIARPARWEMTLRAMGASGLTWFAEIGPGDVLTKLLRWTLRSAKGSVLETPESIDAFVSSLPAEESARAAGGAA